MIRSLSTILVAGICTVGVPMAVGQVAGSSSADSQNEQLEELLPFFELQLPTGPNPYPAMVMVPGCSGFHAERFSRSYDRDSDRFVGLGYAVIRVDYGRAHGLENSCSGAQNPTGQVVSELEISRYIQATVTYLNGRSDIDSEHIYLMGSSLGGGGIFTAMSDSGWPNRDNVAAVLNYFPVCLGMSLWMANVPMLLMLGELDNIQPSQYCFDLAQDSPRGYLIQAVEYPQAHHCFNAEDIPVVTEPRIEATCGYNPEALRASWEDIREFLAEH